MTRYPRVVIDLEKVEHNTKIITDMASKHGMEVTGVTKATCGDPKVAKAMLRGGVKSIGESRIENIIRLKENGVDAEMMLLRTPMPSETRDVVEHADISLNTELNVIRQLAAEAKKLGKTHKVLLMVEMGELREGIMLTELYHILGDIQKLKRIRLIGMGMNLACLSGVVPTKEKIALFDDVVMGVETNFDIELQMIGGGNSANIPLLLEGHPDTKINNLRIGEGILLGLETVNRTPIPDTHQDAFILEAEIIELKEKPSVPDGEVSQNAYGEVPKIQDIGPIKRGILGIGRQDVMVDGLTPLDDGIKVLESSSDHIVVHVKSECELGDIVSFKMNYGTLVHAFTSRYVKKHYLGEA